MSRRPRPGTAGSSAEPIVASDGRSPGRRGRATRQRLLDRTAELLVERGYRELRVVDIARGAGTSPATFYQYFPDVEQAILVLGEGIMADATDLAAHVAGDWNGDPAARASAIVDEFLEFWERHRGVLRVIDLATEEGDLRFQALRTRALNAITEAMAGVLSDARRSGRAPSDVDPMAMAGVLVAMLAHVSSHRFGFEAWGIRTAAVRQSMARILAQAVGGAEA